MKKIGILGSTGSIGTQALKLVEQNPDLFEVSFLSAGKNKELLLQQASKFNVDFIALADDSDLTGSQSKYTYNGLSGICQMINDSETDLVISAIVGFAGVLPTYTALNNGIDVALANKESLVSAGELITETAKKHSLELIAVDSEHSAILQCLAGEDISSVKKIILTASGGPFRTKDKSEFPSITLSDALKHPNWSMGSKITIDSATLMNKGLEVIEARWLFDLPAEKIEVLVHPQSIIHSMVEFCDGSIKAQLGIPDMAVPISYSMSVPHRLNIPNNSIDWTQISKLDFHKPDTDKFPALRLAFDSLNSGSGFCNALNAANEVAVDSFLKGKIHFTDIPVTVDRVLQERDWVNVDTLESVVETDNLARLLANKFIQKQIND